MVSPAATERIIRALQGAFEKSAADPRATAVVAEAIRDTQTSPHRACDVPHLPACAYLDPALAAISSEDELRETCGAFRGIADDLDWYGSQMPCDAQTASDNFPMGHANAMIYGPSGLVLSEKLRVGVSLLAPDVRHPDHSHRPEEVFFVVSEGEFRQGVRLAIDEARYTTHFTLPARCAQGRSHCWRFGRLRTISN
ncbi:hypothetical protein D3C81_317620 [compost metagenome]